MIEQAIEKINAEMQKHPTDEYYEIFGHYCIELCSDEKAVNAILQDGKNLSGAISAIDSAARKRGGSCVRMRDMDMFDEVDKYFGFTYNHAARMEIKRQVDGDYVPPTTPTKPKAPSLNLDFNSFL